MRVFGIDPGTLNLGWGFIEVDQEGRCLSFDHGCLRGPTQLPFFERLYRLSEGLEPLLRDFQPEVAVIEKIFLGKSVDSAFKLGHIRGICAAQCQGVGAQIVEYSPRTVKKQITGSGRAEKSVVQNFLYRQLGIQAQGQSFDASDALALAFCHILQDSVRIKARGLGGP